MDVKVFFIILLVCTSSQATEELIQSLKGVVKSIIPWWDRGNSITTTTEHTFVHKRATLPTITAKPAATTTTAIPASSTTTVKPEASTTTVKPEASTTTVKPVPDDSIPKDAKSVVDDLFDP